MYGLEKQPKHLFEFDLEKDLKQDPNKTVELVKTADGRIQEIKSLLREGTQGPALDQLGVLLHGYTALRKVLSRMMGKK